MKAEPRELGQFPDKRVAAPEGNGDLMTAGTVLMECPRCFSAVSSTRLISHLIVCPVEPTEFIPYEPRGLEKP